MTLTEQVGGQGLGPEFRLFNIIFEQGRTVPACVVGATGGGEHGVDYRVHTVSIGRRFKNFSTSTSSQ